MDSGADVHERLRALEDERAILRTMYAYGHAIDYGEEERWIDCFTEDATFTIRTGDQTGSGGVRAFRGREELARFVGEHTRAPGSWHKHLLSEPIVDVDGDEAHAVSYFVRVDGRSGVTFARGFGRYTDELVRCSDGRWRFSARVAEVEGVDFGPPAGDAQVS